MSSDFDASEFVDNDFQSARKSQKSGPVNPFTPGTQDAAAESGEGGRAPTQEEVDSKVGEVQTKLAELKRAQQELERERASLEELRRRQMEFTTSREEMKQSLTRGVGLLEEAEFNARRDAEQMAKSLTELREALEKIQTIHEESWTKDNLNVELTRALTIVENARMEWNTARLKFPVLSGADAAAQVSPAINGETPLPQALQLQSYSQLCKLGLYLTWPLALVMLLAFVVLVILLVQRNM